MSFAQKLRFVALDIETTGLNERKDEIIQIAAIRFEGGQATKIFDSFVKPIGKLPKFIQALTHISPKDLEDAPDVKTVLGKLREFVGSDPVVGHNVGFDLGFINHNLALQDIFQVL